MTTTAPFVVDPELQGITIAYRNTSLIADAVLPRVGVGKKEFEYTVFDQAERFTIPETLVGRKGVPNEVEFGGTRTAAAVRDYGLDDFVPNDDITQAVAGINGGTYNPLGHAVEATTDLILLDREKRVADTIFAAATYPTGRKTTLSSSSDKWDDYTNSNPQKAIMNALDAALMRPNIMVIGQAAWTILRQHPKLVKAAQGNSGDSGAITREDLARLLEIEEVLVGQSWLNTAKPGQTASISRVWGKHAAFLHRNRNANTQRGVTFGYTAQFGPRIAGQRPTPEKGLRGGITVRVGESVKEVVCSAESAYFFENVIA